MVTLRYIILNYKVTGVWWGAGPEERKKVSEHVNSIVQMYLPIPLNFGVKYVDHVILPTWFKVLQTPRPFRKPMQYSRISTLML